MQKISIFFRLLIFIVISGLLHASPQYQIKLAVYKNLHNLQKKIDSLPPRLNKTVQIIQKGNTYKASTYPSLDKASLQTSLPLYKKVFADAFIGKVLISSMDTIPLPKKIVKKSPKVSLPSSKLNHKTFYLCSKGTKKGKGFLVKVVFKNHTVLYTPIIGKIPPVTALYKTKGNTLYMYQKGLFNKNIYSILEKSYKEYYLFSSWVKGRKIHDLRYYFTLKNAKQYLQKI